MRVRLFKPDECACAPYLGVWTADNTWEVHTLFFSGMDQILRYASRLNNIWYVFEDPGDMNISMFTSFLTLTYDQQDEDGDYLYDYHFANDKWATDIYTKQVCLCKKAVDKLFKKTPKRIVICWDGEPPKQ